MRQEAGNGSGRILALDLGEKRIGLALSDELRLTAQPLATLIRGSLRRNFATLRSLVRTHDVREILLGDPIHPNGQDSSRSQLTRDFAQRLERELSLPVLLWDERYTSAHAERIMAEAGVRKRDDPAVVDRVAAALLLEDYLDNRRRVDNDARGEAQREEGQ